MPPESRKRSDGDWDNSNSQYGALGMWAGIDAGGSASGAYWSDVQSHWESTQTISGGWGYRRGDPTATIAMTAAGTTMLFVARDQLLQAAATGTTPLSPLSPKLIQALEWMDEGDHVTKFDVHKGYTLYGIERAGLASGYKYFGTHDWYAELGKRAIGEQKQEGFWDGTDGPVAETAFHLLFLARGRSPVLISKLSFDGDWTNRPRDVAMLTRYASWQFERPVNWQIADIRRPAFQWSDAPLLFITSDKAPTFRDADVDKIREFVNWGGIVFTHAERGSPDFNNFVEDLARRAFPQYTYGPIPESHPVYTFHKALTPRPQLMGVSNGSRLLLVHSPKEIADKWQTRPPDRLKLSSDIAINVAVYATRPTELRNRLTSPYVPAPTDQPAGVVPLARVKYKGNWDPEPAAWERFGRLMQLQTGVFVKAVPAATDEMNYENFPIAHLTGTEAPNLSDLDAETLRTFVDQGGLLIIDACGGSDEFGNAVTSQVLPRLFPRSVPEPLTGDSSIISSSMPGMKDLSKPLYRPETPRERQMLMLRYGKGTVVFSPLDITSGLLGATTAGIKGYQPQYAQDLAQNMVFWALNHISSGRGAAIQQ
jgi:hypothetical protein